MNKLKITLAIIGIFLIVFVTAQILSIRNVDVELTKSEKDKLTEYNIITPETSELSCDDTFCEYKLFQVLPDNSTYNLGTHTIKRNNLSRLELETLQEEQITKWLKNYAQVLSDRESIQDKEIISNKTLITITEAK